MIVIADLKSSRPMEVMSMPSTIILPLIGTKKDSIKWVRDKRSRETRERDEPERIGEPQESHPERRLSRSSTTDETDLKENRRDGN